jgi:chloramphenicol 3-O-phosphotransferase
LEPSRATRDPALFLFMDECGQNLPKFGQVKSSVYPMAAEKRLVVLYGPPASGKLPIAEAISAETDWILFDNAAAIDFVAQFLPPGTPRFLELIDSLRLDLIRAMLAEGRSVVFTFAYFGFAGEDISFFKFLAAAATSVGASVHLVQLRCSEETLLKRVSNASWHQSWESTTSQNFAKISEHSRLEKSLPGFASLQIDTDSCGPDSAAAMIVECVRKGVLAQRS